MSNVISMQKQKIIASSFNAYRFVSRRRDVIKCRECNHVQSFDLTCSSCGVFLHFAYCDKDHLTHKLVTEFEDGNVVYSVVGIRARYSAKQNNFFIKTVSWRLKKTVKGKYLAFRNNRAYFDTISVDKILQILYPYFEVELPVKDIYEYCHANNPRLKDILSMVSVNDQFGEKPIWEFYNQIPAYVRSRIYRHYDKFGTKGARQALIGTSNKCLLNLAWSNLNVAEAIATGLKAGIDPDMFCHFIDQFGDFFEEGCIPSLVGALSSLVTLGMSPKRSFNYLMKKFKGVRFIQAYMITDTADMYATILKKYNKDYVLPLKGDYSDAMHDRVQRDYNIYILESEGIKYLPKPKIGVMSEGPYGLTYPKLTRELIECGMDMDICVASYIQRVMEKKTQIFFIKDVEGQYKVCLEVNHENRLIQAKLHKNVAVVSDDILCQFVKDWCKKYDVDYTQSYDMSEYMNGVTYGFEPMLNADDLPF